MNRVLLLLLLLSFNSILAQDNFGKVRLKTIQESKQKMTDQSVFLAELKPVSGTEFRLINTKTDKLGMQHFVYQQYYNGVKVEFGVLKSHKTNGVIKSFNGAYFDPTGISTQASISKSSVYSIAKNYMKANDVFWVNADGISKSNRPEPALVILPNRRDETLNLAYSIGIGTSKPALKMGVIYIDARTGDVLKYKNLVFSCFDDHEAKDTQETLNSTSSLSPFVSGTAATVYSGSQNIETTLDASDYILYDQTRANTGQAHNHGSGQRYGIVTVNFNHDDDVNNYGNGTIVTDFTDANNNWTAAEMSTDEDQYALDAHWGAQVVYDYWKNEHGRNSYDDGNSTIASYVHFGTDYTNAGWLAFNSSKGFMVYGDGGGSFTPLTNLDVVSHEIGHGVTNANSNLDYELESGALNEGFSDIWAMVIDNYSNNTYGTTKNIGLLNDENGGGTLRSLSNPNTYGQPDTYGGTYWYDVSGCTPNGTANDYCGVHTNSGVLAYWFWLLSQGGSGTNDNGDNFTVTGIGIEAAAAIAVRMESVYLTSTSDYADARDAAIQAAKDIYGNCSAEEEEVTYAWYAVGVGNTYSGSNPVVTTDTSDQIVCVDEIGTFYAEADYADTMIWQNDASGSWADLSDDTTYSGVATNTLTITNPTEALDGVRFRLKFSNGCGNTTTTNNRYLDVKTTPIVTSVVPSGAGCSSTTDGSLTVSFDDLSNLTNLEFSIDGGVTYPYNYADTSSSQTISGLAAGDYNVWVRRGDDDCPRELGTYTVITVPTIVAAIDTTIEADISQSDGILQVSFNDEPTQATVKFSVDGGGSYPYTFDDALGTGELTGLAAGNYDVWVAFGDDSCAKDLGSFTVNEMAYTQIPDANFENVLNNLTYDNYLGDNKVPTSLINTITSLNVRVENIADLTGIENFTALETLYADNNNLTTVDVSSNTVLKELVVYNNPNLSSFTVADPSIITRITLSNCNLSGDYDFSGYTSLVNFSVQSNDLSGLNVKNGNNTNFTYFHAGGNSSLNCIIVDDAAWSTTNWTDNGSATFTSNYCDYTTILDANFEAALEALGYDDISSDGQVPTALIEVLTSLDVSGQSIADLTGIEDFTALTDLICSNNSLTSLDVSSNVNLQNLDFDNNNVATVSFGTNTNLSEVSGRYNQLTSVDVTANTGLTNLNLRNNTFATVDVSNNTSLTVLNLNSTGITSLDITNNTNLSHIYLSGNSLTSIDFLQNPLLENINLTNNDLTSIDLSNQTVLRIVRLSGNNLTALDLTTNVALTQVECADNNLSSFNFKSGFNQIITDFDASGNPNLSCILIDDLNKDYTFWTKDVTTSFSDSYCRYTAIPDANFEAALAALGYDDISSDGQVPTALIEVITSLDVSNEGISDLTGINDFAALVELNISDNSILTIDISTNILLEKLFYENNGLSSIDVSQNTALTELDLDENTLTTLDVSQNTALTLLDLSDNELTSLDVTTNTALTFLAFERNNVSGAIDLSSHTQLIILACENNDLTGLNLKNGNNTNVTYYNSSGNSNLSCILVDDLANDYSTWTKDAIATFSDTYCRYTAIPDANFEAALEALGYDDITADGQVPTALIEVVTSLGVSQKSISDLTGIEDFTALTSLNCRTNNLTSIDLSNNLQLESFVAWENDLTSLDVSSNTALEVVSIHYNELTSIDVSNNAALRSLQVNNNDITAVDVTNNPALETLKVYGMDLTTLDLSNNPVLDQLVAYSTQITAFDFSNNPVLRILEVHNNAITSIDFSNNPLLESLRINQTQIEDLDLSLQTNLTFLRCFQTNLYNLNVQNGNNTNVTKFDAWSNPNLTCILVDDAAYSSGNTIWADNVDSGVTFNEGTYCRYTIIPDANFETELEALGYDDISGDGQVPTQLIEVVETLDVENKSIADVTGIEDFRALKVLDVGYNSLNTINLTNNTELRQLIVRSNNLTTIDLSANTLLVGFKAENCGLTTLDITNQTDLKVLWLTGNDLTAIDVSNNVALTSFWGNGNDFTTLDLSNNPALNSFRASSNSLTALNLQNGTNTNITGGTNFQLTGNADLGCVLVDDAAYSATYWLGIDGSVNFSDTDCEYTLIPDANFEARLETLGYDDISGDGKVPTRLIEVVTNLNVSNQDIADLTGIEDFTALEVLLCTNNNSLSTINLSNNTNLLSLSAFNCDLTNLDVSNNTSLQSLILYGNSLTSLDVSLNTQLTNLDLLANNLTSIDVTNNLLLQILAIEDNNLSRLDLSNNTALTALTCSNNDNLAYLNVQNGNNTNVTNFVADNNSSLTCIIVDDLANDYTGWTKDVTTSFTITYCRYTAIPDTNFEAALEALGYDDISADGQVPTALIEVVTSLNVNSQGIADLTGIEDFTALESLECRSNSLTTLNVGANLSIEVLDCLSNVTLSTINLGAKANFTTLRAHNNNIESIYLGGCPALTDLNISFNPLTSLDLSNNTNLENLFAEETAIVQADLSMLPNLLEVELTNCSNLTYLNIQNGNNTNITDFLATSTPSLSCIIVDDVAYSSGNADWEKDNATNYTLTGCRYTAIPDADFEAALEALGYDDITADGQVPTYLIETVTNLDVKNLSIADLTGIQDFAALTTLNCSSNSLTTLNVSSNTALESLNFSRNTIAAIDVTNNVNLKSINAFENNLTTIDLSQNTILENLDIDTNFLTALDVSANTLLESLDAYSNSIVEVDLSNNLQLIGVYLSFNTITSLDLSNHTLLEDVECIDCELTNLNLKNGTNGIIGYFDMTSNPNLTCILVDDVTNNDYSSWSKDITASFNDTYCRYTAIPDANFEAALEALGYDDITADGQVPTALIEVVTSLDVRNEGITDVTGIEDFTALETFNCNLNNIAVLDVSTNVNLTALQCTANPIESLDLTNNTLLRELNCRGTDITSLDVTNNTLLKRLICFDTDIVTIDLSQNLLLEDLYCYSTTLTSLNLSLNTALKIVQVQNSDLVSLTIKNGNNTNITNFNASGNPNLTCIEVDDLANDYSTWTKDATATFTDSYCRYTAIPDANFEAALEALGYDDITADGQVPTALIEVVNSLDISNLSIADLTGIEGFTSLKILTMPFNSIPDLDLSGNTVIEELYCYSAVGNSLNVSNMTALKILHCYEAGFTTLNLTNATALEELQVYHSNLTSLDVSTNTALKKLYSYENALSSINLNGAIALEELYIYRSGVTTVDITTNTALTTLHSYEGDLTTLNTAGITTLEDLQVYNNSNLTTLDLSSNTGLKTLNVSGAALTYLNVQNGTNTNITSFDATTNADLTCILVDDATYSTTNWTNKDVTASFNEISCEYVIVDIDVFLQGALLNPNVGEENLMRDDLRVNGHIDSDTPYTDGASISEAVGVTDNGNNSIVDWVWVELRDATDPTIVVAGQSAILQRDGDVVDVADDLITPLTFHNVAAGDYYVVVKHRNHLGIMTANTIALKEVISTVNFTDATNQITYGTNAQTTFGMPSGIVAMWSGNVNEDAIVQYSGTSPDVPSILSLVLNDAGNFLNLPTYAVSEYNTADIDMNGTIQYTGTTPDTPFILQNVLAHPGNFLNFSTYQIQEQLPEN